MPKGIDSLVQVTHFINQTDDELTKWIIFFFPVLLGNNMVLGGGKWRKLKW